MLRKKLMYALMDHLPLVDLKKRLVISKDFNIEISS